MNSSFADDTALLRKTYSDKASIGGAPLSEDAPVFSHRPVMLSECIDALNIRADGTYVDCTAGGGGHSSEIALRLTSGRLISIDRDADAVAVCRKRLAVFGDKVTVVHDNYTNIEAILSRLSVDSVDGVLMDLGVSSYQIDTPERGFSYSSDVAAPLDMRMSREDKLTAYDVVNRYGESELRRIISEYGEERFAGKIAAMIVKTRERAPIETTKQLSELIKSAVPRASVERGSHPAKRTFQAIRIEVNGELDGIEPTLRAACGALSSGGRLAVITFHSLEDRIVKRTFADLAKGCVCPPDFPVCVCGKKPVAEPVNRKPIVSGEEELSENPRARSAKLRVTEKL